MASSSTKAVATKRVLTEYQLERKREFEQKRYRAKRDRLKEQNPMPIQQEDNIAKKKEQKRECNRRYRQKRKAQRMMCLTTGRILEVETEADQLEVDRTFRDLLKNTIIGAEHKPFGGKTVVLGGDFRQILPVIVKGRREQIVSASLHKSELWNNCEVLLLTKNMRLESAQRNPNANFEVEHFAKWILDVGNGEIEGISLSGDLESNWIKIPDDMLLEPAKGMHGLIDVVYPNIEEISTDPNYLKGRAILAPRNDEVDDINDTIIQRFSGKCHSYLSADEKVPIGENSTEEEVLYTSEYLNSLKCSGLANHCLDLKVGAPIMLLRNLNPSIGLCNGTRLIVRKMGQRVLEAEIVTGVNIGKCVAIPRIIMSSEQTDMPFILKRRQLPVCLSFAMTINKSQGQTLDNIGLYLRTPVFCHGQLYVGLSRATSRDAVKVLLEEQTDVPFGYTQNIVYKEVLQAVLQQVVQEPTETNNYAEGEAQNESERIGIRRCTSLHTPFPSCNTLSNNISSTSQGNNMSFKYQKKDGKRRKLILQGVASNANLQIFWPINGGY